MRERARPSTKRSSPPRRLPSTTRRSAAPARKSETTASTAIPQPAIAIPVWPVGTNTDRRPRRRASRSSSRATVFFPIAQSEPTVSATWRKAAGSRRSARSGRPAASVDREARRRGGPPARPARVVGDELVQAALDVEAVRDAGLQQLAPGGGKRPPWVATPTSAVVGPRPRASSTAATIGIPSWSRRPASSPGSRRSGRAHSGSRPARSCRSAGRRSGPQRGSGTASRTPRPGCVGGELHAVDEHDAGPWILGEQQVAVEVDVVEEARHLGARPRRQGPTHSCSRASARARARGLHGRTAPPRGFRRTSRASRSGRAHARRTRRTSASVWQSSST